MATLLVCATGAGSETGTGTGTGHGSVAAQVAAYRDAGARRNLRTHVVTSAGDGLPGGARPAGVVASDLRSAELAAETARRHGLAWHDVEAVTRAGDRLYVLGRLTATGMPVPRFAAVDAATGDGLERLAGLPSPWRVTGGAGPVRRIARVQDLEGLQALASAWRDEAGGGDGLVVERLAIEPAWDGPSWLVVGLLDAGALRVVGIIDVDAASGPAAQLARGAEAGRTQPAGAAGTCLLSAPTTLARDAQAHLAGLVAHGCRALGLTQGPVLARAVTVAGRACLVDVAPTTLDVSASAVIAIVGPALEPLTLADLVVRQAVGDPLDEYGMDGSFRHVRMARPDPNHA